MKGAASPLLDATIDQVKAGWTERLHLPISTFFGPGIKLVSREVSNGLVVLQIQDSVVAVFPPALLPFLSSCSETELLDLATLLKILKDFQPTPIGIATIGYSDSATISNSPISDHAHVVYTDEVTELLSSCTLEEYEESGLLTMPHLFGARSEDGRVRTIAGYEAWNSKIAQMGILTMPSHRRKGFAFRAALTAAQAALETGLIPQWRCRIGNESSLRLSHQLGFHGLGCQLAVDLTL